MTTTELLERQEAPPEMAEHVGEPDDLQRLAEIRETVFQIRKERFDADPYLDPRLRERFLDRSIWGTDDIRHFLQYADASIGRISKMRTDRTRVTPDSVVEAMTYRPGELPTMDASLGIVKYSRPLPGVEAGRVIEALYKDHRILWNHETGEFYPNPNFRSGRPRQVRGTRARPSGQYQPKPVDRRRKPPPAE
jgi:hypothetical protein